MTTISAQPGGIATPDEAELTRISRRSSVRRKQALWIWLFLFPTVVLYGVYTIYPIIASYWYSFVEWNGFAADRTFVGLRNYRTVFADPLFWSSFKITIIFMLLVAPARVILSFLLAIVLNSPKLPFSKLFRTVFFLPVVTTTAIVGVVMQFILDPSSGPINAILIFLGIRGWRQLPRRLQPCAAHGRGGLRLEVLRHHDDLLARGAADHPAGHL